MPVFGKDGCLIRIIIKYTPLKSDIEYYRRITDKIFAEKPLWAFNILSLILIAVTAVKCFQAPSFSIATAIALMAALFALGTFGLWYTRKRKPFVAGELQKTLGIQQTVTFSDNDITICADGPELTVSAGQLVTQYIMGNYYIAYLATTPHRLLIIPITQENKESVDEAATYYVKHRIPLKKLRG